MKRKPTGSAQFVIDGTAWKVEALPEEGGPVVVYHGEEQTDNVVIIDAAARLVRVGYGAGATGYGTAFLAVQRITREGMTPGDTPVRLK